MCIVIVQCITWCLRVKKVSNFFYQTFNLQQQWKEKFHDANNASDQFNKKKHAKAMIAVSLFSSHTSLSLSALLLPLCISMRNKMCTKGKMEMCLIVLCTYTCIKCIILELVDNVLRALSLYCCCAFFFCCFNWISVGVCMSTYNFKLKYQHNCMRVWMRDSLS